MASEQHLALSEYIKNVHKELRVLSNSVGPEQAWNDHCNNETVLQKYAEAMKTLATHHWVKSSEAESRIEWVVERCKEYFFNEGLLESNDHNVTEKHRVLQSSQESFSSNEKIIYHGENRVENNRTNLSGESDILNDHDQRVSLSEQKDSDSSLFRKAAQKIEENKEATLAKKHGITYDPEALNIDFLLNQYKLELLDVGSCYNPFKTYNFMFQVTAVDLYPATDDVVKCDFLTEEFSSSGVLVKDRYHIVVFSLFLEYLPSPEQRYASCRKAYDLLKPSGLLFILTPDSKHASANSKLMKRWRICLSSIGFMRVYYDKSKHLHCMAFRKNVIRELPLNWYRLKKENNDDSCTMLRIPQDDMVKRDSYNESSENGTVMEPKERVSGFDALPLT